MLFFQLNFIDLRNIYESMKRTLIDIQLLERMALDSSNASLAFEEIYNHYSKNMFIYAMSVFKDKQICEDIVQNVFIDIWSKRKQLKIKKLKAYLFKAVKYQIFNYLRDRKISHEDLTRLNLIDISMDVSRKLEFEELEELIDKEVNKLSSRCRQIFVLSRYQHKSNKEISSELGISIQAVKNQISKALGSIRQNISSEEVVFYFLLLNCW